MGVYIKPGVITPTRVPAADQATARTTAADAIKLAADKVSGFQSTPDPKSQAGISVGLLIAGYAQDANGYTCTVIGQFAKLPKGDSFTTNGSPRGKGTGPTLLDCLTAAVKELLDGTKTELIAAVGAPSTPATAATAKARIYIDTFKVKYGAGPPQALKQKAETVLAKAAAKVVTNHKSKRFFMGSPPANPSDPGYRITIEVVEAKPLAAPDVGISSECKGTVDTYPALSMLSQIKASGSAKAIGGTKDSDYLGAMEGAAERYVDTVLTYLDSITP